MRKLFFLILLAGGFYVGWEIHTKGKDEAFGGVFAPLESVNKSETPLATQLTPLAQPADVPTAAPPHRGPSGRTVKDRALAARNRSRRR